MAFTQPMNENNQDKCGGRSVSEEILHTLNTYGGDTFLGISDMITLDMSTHTDKWGGYGGVSFSSGR
jgi:hypothetical protein